MFDQIRISQQWKILVESSSPEQKLAAVNGLMKIGRSGDTIFGDKDKLTNRSEERLTDAMRILRSCKDAHVWKFISSALVTFADRTRADAFASELRNVIADPSIDRRLTEILYADIAKKAFPPGPERDYKTRFVYRFLNSLPEAQRQALLVNIIHTMAEINEYPGGFQYYVSFADEHTIESALCPYFKSFVDTREKIHISGLLRIAYAMYMGGPHPHFTQAIIPYLLVHTGRMNSEVDKQIFSFCEAVRSHPNGGVYLEPPHIRT